MHQSDSYQWTSGRKYSQPVGFGLATDAVMYARDIGVSHDEAMWRLTKQDQFGDLVLLIQNAAPGRFGGSWIQHEGDFQLHIRLTGEETPTSINELAGQQPGLVTIHAGAALALADAEALLTNMGPELDQHPAAQGVFYDVRHEEFVIDMIGVPTPTRSAGEVIADLRATLPPEVLHARINLLDTPVELARRGGLHLNNNCTSGFTVRSGSQRGILTAAHCSNELAYRLYGSSTWFGTTFRAERYDHQTDAQWNQVSASVVEPTFHGSSTSTARLFTGQRSRIQQDGAGICKRGMTTGYSCGFVTSITYRPTHQGACGGSACVAAWVRAEGPSLQCNLGDSGGPVFTNGIAYGLTSAVSARVTSSGVTCLFNIHMPINHIAALNVSLLFA